MIRIFIFTIAIILGYIIGKIIIDKTIKKGPDSNIIIKKIFKFNNNYYQFIPEICVCPLNTNIF
jgi:hypothetical protein